VAFGLPKNPVHPERDFLFYGFSIWKLLSNHKKVKEGDILSVLF